MLRKLILPFFLLFSIIGLSQNTVGVVLNSDETYNGYTLFTSHTETFLINNCGVEINKWSSSFNPGNSVYLLENGNLLRTGRTDSQVIYFGGQGGVVELYSWEGELIWQYYYDTEEYRQHHDVFPMPNGNVLILAAKVMSNAEAIQLGRNPDLLPESILYSEQIVEVQPSGTNGGTIVWEWDIKNHLVQDFDDTKDNFGIIADNSDKLDINFTNGGDGGANWLHVNSVQYNVSLDQIILSSRNLSEIWIIDHSTTTAQAATPFGGIYGKGGSLLYRWGNPQAYKKGNASDQKLFGQHYPHWIPDGLIDGGKLMVFNNGNGRIPQFSEIYILNPPTTAPGNYFLTTNGVYGPEAPDFVYADNSASPSPFLSNTLSSANRLPNGNILICEGINGEIFEINAQKETVWKYINPVHSSTGIRATQGEELPNVRTLFRATKYAINYPAFEGRDLTPGIPIELNFGINTPCNTTLEINKSNVNEFTVSPNPTSGMVTITSQDVIKKTETYNMQGIKISTIQNTNSIDLSSFSNGIYLLKIFTGDTVLVKKVIKK